MFPPQAVTMYPPQAETIVRVHEEAFWFSVLRDDHVLRSDMVGQQVFSVYDGGAGGSLPSLGRGVAIVNSTKGGQVCLVLCVRTCVRECACVRVRVK